MTQFRAVHFINMLPTKTDKGYLSRHEYITDISVVPRMWDHSRVSVFLAPCLLQLSERLIVAMMTVNKSESLILRIQILNAAKPG